MPDLYQIWSINRRCRVCQWRTLPAAVETVRHMTEVRGERVLLLIPTERLTKERQHAKL